MNTLKLLMVSVCVAAVAPTLTACTQDLPQGFNADEGQTYHPDGFARASVHGQAFFLSMDSCRQCHGENLDGGFSGVDCNGCHKAVSANWTGDCTFCHGGQDNDLGAPPQGVEGETDTADRAVGAHTVHLEHTAFAPALECQDCHEVPASVQQQGHIDGQAQVSLNPQKAGEAAAYDRATGTCTSVYCHGNGREAAASVSWTAGLNLGCNGCHADAATASDLSGAHASHAASMACQVCHGDTLDSAGAIADLSVHIDGAIQVTFAADAGSNASYDQATGACSSVYCHGNGRNAGGPVAWDTGLTLGCNGCHGAKDDASRLSGLHATHLEISSGFTCATCHKEVASDNQTIVDAGLHVNGVMDVSLKNGSFDPDAKTCTDACHSGTRPWEDDDR